MPQLFYDHLIHFQEVIEFLDSHPLAEEEKLELVSIIDEIYHHHILDLIFTHLPKTHHEEFISLISSDPCNPSHITYLQNKVTVDISAEISKQSQKVKSSLIKEIKKAKRSSPIDRPPKV